jgi:hypothetical protein
MQRKPKRLDHLSLGRKTLARALSLLALTSLAALTAGAVPSGPQADATPAKTTAQSLITTSRFDQNHVEENDEVDGAT